MQILISINHKRVIEYSQHPWPDVDAMNEGLIKNWNSRVGKDDRVFVLGDFSFGNKQQILDVVPRLNGTKILVRGNHDIRSGVFYVEAGFAAVSPYPMFYTDESHGFAQRFLLSHKPIFPQVGDLINIHGHLHDGVNPNFWAPQHICVSVEMINYRPARLSEILAMLKEKNDKFPFKLPIDLRENYDARDVDRSMEGSPANT